MTKYIYYSQGTCWDMKDIPVTWYGFAIQMTIIKNAIKIWIADVLVPPLFAVIVVGILYLIVQHLIAK